MSVKFTDRAINKLLEKRTAGALTLSEETQLHALEAARGQIDLLQMDVEDARIVAETRIRTLRLHAEDLERRAQVELERGDHSQHRRQEYYNNAMTYTDEAKKARAQIRELEHHFRLGIFSPDSEAMHDAPAIVIPPKPQLELF